MQWARKRPQPQVVCVVAVHQKSTLVQGLVMRVSNSQELDSAVANPSLKAGGTILLASGVYTAVTVTGVNSGVVSIGPESGAMAIVKGVKVGKPLR